MVGSVLAALVIVALVAIGVGGLVAPGRASAQYGIVLDDGRALAFIRAMAVRDLVLGGVLALLATTGARQLVGWAMWLAAAVALVDLAVVVADRRDGVRATGRTAPVLHASGAIGLVVTGAALLAGW